jgi:hypothetical protein
VAIAMGRAGMATRLLAPRFPRAFLTFASLDRATAPGQVSVQDWLDHFGFQQTAEADPLLVAFTPDPIPWPRIDALRHKARTAGRAPWVLPIPVQQLTTDLLRALQLAGVVAVTRLSGVAVDTGPAAHIPANGTFHPLTDLLNRP